MNSGILIQRAQETYGGSDTKFHGDVKKAIIRVPSDKAQSNGNQPIFPIIEELNRYLPFPALQFGDHLMHVMMVKLAHLYSPELLHLMKRLREQIDILSFRLAQLEAVKQTAAGSDDQNN